MTTLQCAGGGASPDAAAPGLAAAAPRTATAAVAAATADVTTRKEPLPTMATAAGGAACGESRGAGGGQSGVAATAAVGNGLLAGTQP